MDLIIRRVNGYGKRANALLAPTTEATLGGGQNSTARFPIAANHFCNPDSQPHKSLLLRSS